MREFGIIMLIFGGLILLVGVYLTFSRKGDFTQVLLWKSNVKKMSQEQVSYAGKVTMFVSLAPIIFGICAMLIESESFLPIIVLLVSFIFLLLISIKIFR